MSNNSVLVVAPEFLNPGGVQAFSRAFVTACCELLGGNQVVVCGRNDDRRELLRIFPQVRDTAGLARIPQVFRRLAAPGLVTKLVRRHQPSAILCTHPHLAGACVGHGMPVVVVCHGIDCWDLGASLIATLKRADLLLAVSRFTQAQVARQLPGRRLSILANTFDADRFQYRDRNDAPSRVRHRLELPSYSKLLLAVARLERTEIEKGYDDVVLCLPDVLERHRNTWFVLAGRGPDSQRIRKLAKKVGVSDRVILPGHISPNELPDLYRAAEVFVLPSRKEGFGIVFIEALSVGTPVIAGNADGSTDALLDGELGQLIPPRDRTALAAAICAELSRDPVERIEAAKRNAQRVFEQFGPKRFRETLREHLRTVGIEAVRSNTDAVCSLAVGTMRDIPVVASISSEGQLHK